MLCRSRRARAARRCDPPARHPAAAIEIRTRHDGGASCEVGEHSNTIVPTPTSSPVDNPRPSFAWVLFFHAHVNGKRESFSILPSAHTQPLSAALHRLANRLSLLASYVLVIRVIRARRAAAESMRRLAHSRL